jgi:hypothetical protein
MYSWKDRIKDWWYRVSERWELRREVWVHIGIAVVIALGLTGIILGATVSRWNADMDFQSEYFMDNLAAHRAQVQADYAQFQVNMEEVAEDFRAYLDEQLALYQGQITSLEATMGQLRTALDDLSNDGFPYVSGTWGNYTLHMMSMSGGNFTANVHMLAGNNTAWMNMGVFQLVPGEELVVPVDHTGLNITWIPVLVYAEVFRIV